MRPSHPKVCRRHAELSAGIISGGPGWVLAPSGQGVIGWKDPHDVISVMMSFRDYGPIGRWRYVSVGRRTRGTTPTRTHLNLVRRTFCVPETPVEEFPSPYAPSILYLVQRIYRGIWQVHPDRERILVKRRALDIADELKELDPPVEPACASCGGRHWLRDAGVDGAACFCHFSCVRPARPT